MSDQPANPESAPLPKAVKTPLLFKEDSTGGESRFLNISLRGWIAFFVVGGFVAACLRAGRAEAPALLKDVAIMVVTYYFATRSIQPTKTNP